MPSICLVSQTFFLHFIAVPAASESEFALSASGLLRASTKVSAAPPQRHLIALIPFINNLLLPLWRHRASSLSWIRMQ